jgi:hypothetical protein
MTDKEREMTQADFDYLRNISTRPGPGAGHSIDPTKPGPDDVLPREHQDPSKWPTRETMERVHAAQSDVKRNIEELKAYGWRLPVNAVTFWGASEPPPDADAEPDVRPAWVEPDENEKGKYILCIQTPAQVCTFDVGPLHFADALAKAINGHVKLALAQSDEPLGFRTSDVPDPYKEGPQSNAEPVASKRIAELEAECATLASAAQRWQRVARDNRNRAELASSRPDASVGLVAASILLDNRADEHKGKNDNIERSYRMAACFLRARAAERS